MLYRQYRLKEVIMRMRVTLLKRQIVIFLYLIGHFRNKTEIMAAVRVITEEDDRCRPPYTRVRVLMHQKKKKKKGSTHENSIDVT